MKNGFIRVAAAAPRIKVADVRYNAAQIIEEVKRSAESGVEVLVFPELSLCGYTCGDLFFQRTLTDACAEALCTLAEETKSYPVLFFVGLPVCFAGELYNCAAGICNGKIVGVVPKTHLPNYGEFYERRYFTPAPKGLYEVALGRVKAPFSADLIFRDRNCPELAVACEICEDLWATDAPSSVHATHGAVVIANLSASDETVGKSEYRKKLLAAQSGKTVCAYVYADAGEGESTSDMVFAGNHFIYENGSLLAEAEPFSGAGAVAEIDAAFLLSERRRLTTFASVPSENACMCEFVGDSDLKFRKIPKTPFVPSDGEMGSRTETILNIQSHALKKRLEHTHARTAVLGISGGLDSTLALLVTVRAFDLLDKDRKDILCVTMPCFGTSAGTKRNAMSLMRALGVTMRSIPISRTVLAHFKDIGQDKNKFDAVYENAQARYRTLILMDLANKTGGLVIGTGDLSELALGWCTYNGDHMSMYAVNASVPKTLVKYLVQKEGERLGGTVKKILDRVLSTEISPELLPPDQDGAISQKTEDLVGPYELHDFFLYRALRCGDPPKRVYALASYTFAEKYSPETLKKWLVNFYRRFFSQQFKRNCVPDGVKVGSVSLSPRADWRMPSDAEAALWLEEAENV